MKILTAPLPRPQRPAMLPLCAVLAMAFTTPVAWAQAGASTQVVKPPIATAYIDVATSASDIPGMGAMAGAMRGAQGGGGLFGALGGLMKGGAGGSGGNTFGNTHGGGFGAPGKYVDISVATTQNPALQAAEQQISSPFGLASPLKLVSPPPPEKPEPVDDDKVVEPTYEKPKGKISLYWGCGDTVRPGQPRVLDMAHASMEDFGKFFTMRNSTTRGARLRYGQPSWPNKVDDRRVPDSASLLGEHSITGDGIPEGFKFNLDDPQDLMPPLELSQQKLDGAVQLEWKPLSYARGYFLSALGGKATKGGGGADGAEVVIWTSSELPELGYALVDYQANASVDKWIKEKVVLPPVTTRCTVPKGIFGEDAAGMLRMIAYGSESYFAYPPRPKDVKKAWEPQWQAKVRTKSTLFSMLGGMPGGRGQPGEQGDPSPQRDEPKPGVGSLLKGLFGR